MNNLSSADDDDLDVDDYDEARLDAILPDDDPENKELVGIAPRKPAVPSDTCTRTRTRLPAQASGERHMQHAEPHVHPIHDTP